MVQLSQDASPERKRRRIAFVSIPRFTNLIAICCWKSPSSRTPRYTASSLFRPTVLDAIRTDALADKSAKPVVTMRNAGVSMSLRCRRLPPAALRLHRATPCCCRMSHQIGGAFRWGQLKRVAQHLFYAAPVELVQANSEGEWNKSIISRLERVNIAFFFAIVARCVKFSLAPR